jgi:hypothetical protein
VKLTLIDSMVRFLFPPILVKVRNGEGDDDLRSATLT